MRVRYVCQREEENEPGKEKRGARTMRIGRTKRRNAARRGGGCLKSWRKTVAVFTGAAGRKTFQTAAFEWSSIVRRTLRRAARCPVSQRADLPSVFFRAKGKEGKREKERGRERKREGKLARACACLVFLFLRFIFIGKFVVNLSGTIYRGGTLRANESDLVEKKKRKIEKK